MHWLRTIFMLVCEKIGMRIATFQSFKSLSWQETIIIILYRFLTFSWAQQLAFFETNNLQNYTQCPLSFAVGRGGDFIHFNIARRGSVMSEKNRESRSAPVIKLELNTVPKFSREKGTSAYKNVSVRVVSKIVWIAPFWRLTKICRTLTGWQRFWGYLIFRHL